MQEQVAEIVVTTPEVAAALRDIPILIHFVQPASPSDVARDTNMPANLVHHHAKRALELDLLFETKREDRKVFYQLAARTFKYARDLLNVEEQEINEMKQLSDAFVKAYMRSDLIAGHLDPEYAIYGFGDTRSGGNIEDLKPEFTPFESSEARPAHFQARTFRLSASAYKNLVQDISSLIMKAQSDSKNDSDVCSFAFLAFDGELREGQSDSQSINSFLALPNP
jgi:hypothetical protein